MQRSGIERVENGEFTLCPALVPGAGPAIEGDSWRVARHPKHRRRRKPYLTDNVELGRAFRKHYVRGLRRLLRQGKLQIGGTVDFLNDPVEREQWFSDLEQTTPSTVLTAKVPQQTIEQA